MWSIWSGWGHRHIAAVGISVDQVRALSLAEALGRHGLRLAPELDIMANGYHRDGFLATEKLLRSGRPFTAVVAQNDICALGVMERLMAEGLKVPQDVSVVGFDNLFESASYPVPLTTSGPDRDEVVHFALELLGAGQAPMAENLVYGKVVEPVFVARESTGPARHCH